MMATRPNALSKRSGDPFRGGKWPPLQAPAQPTRRHPLLHPREAVSSAATRSPHFPWEAINPPLLPWEAAYSAHQPREVVYSALHRKTAVHLLHLPLSPCLLLLPHTHVSQGRLQVPY